MRSVTAPTVAAWAVLCVWLAAPICAQAPFGSTIMGKILWPGHDLSRGQVRVYADRGLSTLVDQFGTGGAKGTFVLLVEPGEYYLMAVVDENGNGNVDGGDGLGFFGVTKFGAEGQAPVPVKVAQDAVVKDVHIPITAAIGEDGKPTPVADPGTVDAAPPGVPASVGGTVAGLEELSGPAFLMLLAAVDHRPADVVRLAPTAADFRFTAEPGDYHLIVVADVSADGKVGPGDLAGAYGVIDWSEPPQDLPALTLGADDEIGGIQVGLTGRVGEDGVVNPPGGTGRFQLDITTLPGVVSGTVVHPAAGIKPAQVRLSADPGMSQPIASVECEPGPGTFASLVNPGTYYLTAIVDEDGDGRFGPGDVVGFYGIADMASAQAPSPVTVEHGSLLADLEIRIIARVTEDRKLAPIALDETPEEPEN